MSGLLCAELG